MSEGALIPRSPGPSLLNGEAPAPAAATRGFSLGMLWEVVRTGLVELWAHKMRSLLTLTLLMLGVFALVVMTSVLDGIMDKITTGFAGMSWDGTVRIAPKTAETGDERKRFDMSPGLRYEDISRVASTNPKVLAFLPRAQKSVTVRVLGDTERIYVIGVSPDYAQWMNRPIALGRGLTEDDQRRRSTVAVVGATLANKLFGGGDPVGRDLVVEGVPFRIVGVQAPAQIFNDENYYDANGILIPLQAYMDRMDPAHKLAQITVKLRRAEDMGEVSAMLLGRVRQAHHGIEDV